MTTLFILFAIVYFFLELYLLLRFGSDHPIWPGLLLFIPLIAVIFMGNKGHITDATVALISMIFAQRLAAFIAFPILRKRAGDRILTYKKSATGLIGAIFGSGFFLYLSYMMSIPHTISYPSGEPVYTESFYRMEIPFMIMVGLMGVFMIPTIFRKGEFFENGIATPDLQYFSWNGYKSYKWTESERRKTDGEFSLFLEGGRNLSFTIHGFSSDKKDILDGLLSATLKKKS